MQDDLVVGRDCGSCNVCCVALTVDRPELQKLPGYPCHNCRPDGGCQIYDTRPQTCRRFYCAWRRLDWIGPALRPDVSGVLSQVRRVDADTAGSFEMVFLLLRPEALNAVGLADSVAAAVRTGWPTYLHVAGRAGYTAIRFRLDERLHDAARDGDHAVILRSLEQLYADGRALAGRPVLLTSYQD